MKRFLRGVSRITVTSFLLSLVLCGVLITAAIINRINIEKLQLEQFILENSIQLNEMTSRLSSRTQSLSALVIQGSGDVEDFEKVAPAIIAEDPAVLNVLIAPDGIVTKVYPLEENESIIGWDFFDGSMGSKEALIARDTGNFILSGPFDTDQGDKTLIGKMPVYIDTPAAQHQFWGLVAVTLKFPQVLEDVDLEIFKSHNLIYELWRINPDTEERQVIAHSLEYAIPDASFVERNVHIPNAEWYLKVWLIHVWYNFTETYILIVAGLLTSLLVFIVVRNNTELRRMKTVFEEMAHIDSLTGIYNRRYMDENLKRIINFLSRSNGILSLLMIDVDLFKNYNDAYGHNKGDVCLKTVAEVLRVNLSRTNDFVARYGGEEFVVVLPNTDENGARIIADRLLDNVRNCNIPHKASNVADHVTISIGVTTGVVRYTLNGDDYIKQADKALYMSKQNGRDRYIYLNL